MTCVCVCCSSPVGVRAGPPVSVLSAVDPPGAGRPSFPAGFERGARQQWGHGSHGETCSRHAARTGVCVYLLSHTHTHRRVTHRCVCLYVCRVCLHCGERAAGWWTSFTRWDPRALRGRCLWDGSWPPDRQSDQTLPKTRLLHTHSTQVRTTIETENKWFSSINKNLCQWFINCFISPTTCFLEVLVRFESFNNTLTCSHFSDVD